jgi:hypothetical protein
MTTGQSEKYINPSHVYVTDKEKFLKLAIVLCSGDIHF